MNISLQKLQIQIPKRQKDVENYSETFAKITLILPKGSHGSMVKALSSVINC